MTDLRTDYKDDVLDTTVNTQRKYQMTTNEDGTVSFTDVTEYVQVGDSFGAADVNGMNEAVNSCFQSVSDGKALVASAITDKGVSTAVDATFETMAENIGQISKGKCIYLGVGTSFNVQSVCANNGLDYKKLTNSNFIVGASGGGGTSITNTSASGYYNNPVASVGGFTVSRSYNASTGVLTISGNGQTVTAKLTGNDSTRSTTQGITVFAYLVYVG